MVNEEILGGLRFAFNKGESPEKAMTSFYNAGYRREEIEEAIMFLKQEGPAGSSRGEKIVQTKKTESITTQNPKFIPKISSYGQEKNKKSNSVKKAGKWLLTALIMITIIFVGLLITFLLIA